MRSDFKSAMHCASAAHVTGKMKSVAATCGAPTFVRPFGVTPWLDTWMTTHRATDHANMSEYA